MPWHSISLQWSKTKLYAKISNASNQHNIIYIFNEIKKVIFVTINSASSLNMVSYFSNPSNLYPDHHSSNLYSDHHLSNLYPDHHPSNPYPDHHSSNLYSDHSFTNMYQSLLPQIHTQPYSSTNIYPNPSSINTYPNPSEKIHLTFSFVSTHTIYPSTKTSSIGNIDAISRLYHCIGGKEAYESLPALDLSLFNNLFTQKLPKSVMRGVNEFCGEQYLIISFKDQNKKLGIQIYSAKKGDPFLSHISLSQSQEKICLNSLLKQIWAPGKDYYDLLKELITYKKLSYPQVQIELA